MKRLYAFVIAAALCFPSIGAWAWWQSIQQVSVGGSTPFGLTHVSNANNIAPGGSSCDVGTISIGAADSTRQLIIAIGARFTTAANISSVSVGGNAASQVTSANANLSSAMNATLWQISLASGTTADVTATYSNTVLRCEVDVYRVVGSTATIGTGNAQTSSSTTSLSSTGLSISTGGAAVGVAVGAGGATDISATNLALDTHGVIGATTTTYAAGQNTSGSGATTFTITYNLAAQQGAAAFVTISP